MSSTPPPSDLHAELERRPEDYGPMPSDVETFARIEGLAGEEDALLRIPADQRTGEQHERLHHITTELDRIFEHLRERAERVARRRSAPDDAS